MVQIFFKRQQFVQFHIYITPELKLNSEPIERASEFNFVKPYNRWLS